MSKSHLLTLLIPLGGELRHENEGVAWCQARVTGEDGHLVARAQGTFRYLPLPSGPRT